MKVSEHLEAVISVYIPFVYRVREILSLRDEYYQVKSLIRF